ncbi:hypothetical protein BDL97_11G034700 [Sphagnum fallax]|nr:hypothetical protein BDL97_11G034700 [Sphagnum fallax]
MGHPIGNHVIPKEDFPRTSKSGNPKGVLPSPALQQTIKLWESLPHTDQWVDGIAYGIPNHLHIEDGFTIDEIPFGDFHG